MSIEICAIVKNEARYIAEWLEYHILLGVSQFTIYDNGSEDELSAVCNLFDCVTLLPWPYRDCQQRTAYQDYLRREGEKSIWTAFIDADEFIAPPPNVELLNMLSGLGSDIGGIEMPWVIFDSNEHDVAPPGLVMESYTRAHSIAPQRNVKTICRPRAVNVEEFLSPHRFSYNFGYRAVEASIQQLPLFHYMLRSRADVRLKVARGDVWSQETERKRLANVDKAVQSILDKYDNADRSETRMLAVCPQIRKRLANRGLIVGG